LAAAAIKNKIFLGHKPNHVNRQHISKLRCESMISRTQIAQIIWHISKSPDQYFFRELTNICIAAAEEGDGAGVPWARDRAWARCSAAARLGQSTARPGASQPSSSRMKGSAT
jgi:hypothetical protein